MKAGRLRWIMNLWPPFLASGIRVLEISEDWREARVVLRNRWYNRNYVGVHFGGNLFSMTDPFWMLLIRECLGTDYVVWDSAAEIRFIAPGRREVFAHFKVTDEVLDEIRAATADGDKHLRWFDIPVDTADGQAIAHVRKQLYVRRKRSTPPVTTPDSG